MPVPEIVERLASEFPLSARWGRPEVFFDDFHLDSIHLYMVGISVACADGQCGVVGAAASAVAPEFERAWFEIIERSATLDFLAHPKSTLCAQGPAGAIVGLNWEDVFPIDEDSTSRLSKSNGVACDKTLAGACTRAFQESLERDQILRCWLGQQVGVVRRVSPIKALLPLEAYYRFYDGSFASSESEVAVVGVFGIPSHPSRSPLLCGFGAALTHDAASSKAWAEVCQRLGFLWGESIPVEQPAFSPSADYQQEWSLTLEGSQAIEAWLLESMANSQTQRPARKPMRAPLSMNDCLFLDMTPTHLKGKLFVVKALSLPMRLLPLYFGKMPEAVYGAPPPGRAIHPIA